MINGPFGGQNFAIDTTVSNNPPPIIMMPVIVEGTTRTLHAVYQRDHPQGQDGMCYYYNQMMIYQDKEWKDVDVEQYRTRILACMKCGHKTGTYQIRSCVKCMMPCCPECDSRDYDGVCRYCQSWIDRPESGKDEDNGDARII